ncbi:MAG TPA: hypothetical protein VEG64_14530 [Candidatus Sulfotelmatobacter sp.]|nr:hypothetical protein [Candidatus Sulfotelmatobacter sp.]
MAIGEKLDCVAGYEGYVFQIQGELCAGPLQLEEPAQFVSILCLDSTAESENDFAIRFSLDL